MRADEIALGPPLPMLRDMQRTHINRTKLRTRAVRLSAVAIATAGVIVTPAARPAAAADELTCGATVTTDVRLTTDLLGCTGPGLVVGAPGVTIDLAGHSITGTGSGAGIDDGAGHDRVRVHNGTISGFVFGVHLFESDSSQLADLTIKSNLDGIKIERSRRVEIDRTFVFASVANGIEVTFSDRVTVRDTSVTSSGLGGIVDRFNIDSRYEGNTMIGNGGPGLVVNRTENARLDRNLSIFGASSGIELTGTEGARLTRNGVVGNASDGISIDRPGNTLTSNEAYGNGGFGIAAPDGTIDRGGNLAADNVAGSCTGVVCS
jgi:parallel beta-helix repeat protein